MVAGLPSTKLGLAPRRLNFELGRPNRIWPLRGTWGKYIKLDKDTMDKWTFDQAMILFEVESLKNIMAFTRLVVNGKDYFVRASIVDIVRSEARIRIDHAGEDTSEEDLSE
ncbi:hypothetical protein QUC31_014009 [Theobroma cacao]|uniref:Uncharacterized protein n=1 Tax=Theobroma cacao TaxID=3641 RepID=A0A061E8K9_THECC|nr:Uncharacterized protein TCM_010892 [Theobroma cacao]